jgi:tRNA wybutosine-synthesizing protein 1
LKLRRICMLVFQDSVYYNNMPSYAEVYDFARRLAEKTGYLIIGEAAESRVVLLSKRRKPIRLRLHEQ